VRTALEERMRDGHSVQTHCGVESARSEHCARRIQRPSAHRLSVSCAINHPGRPATASSSNHARRPCGEKRAPVLGKAAESMTRVRRSLWTWEVLIGMNSPDARG
jgi:hypothetical protein